MKRPLLASVGIAALAMTSALASDMPPSRYLPPPRAAAYVPFFTWNGFYVGINAGYGFGKSRWTDSTTGVSTGNFDISGAVAGGTMGYNMQFGSTIFGVETDIDWTNIKGSATANCASTCQTSNDWLGTLRGRLGYTLDRLLPFVSAGLAYGNIKGDLAGGSNFNDFKVGWTAGGGLEYAFAGNWTAKAEYLYVDLGKANCDAICFSAAPFDVTFQTHILRGGLNYKF
jgi:outer membrane immunogenic protein